MKPLFFVHTPFQMYVAQQIIAQEKFTDVVFILGSVGCKPQFYKAYDLMLSDVPFNYKAIIKDNIAEMFTIGVREYFRHIHRAYSSKHFIDRIIKKNGITEIYLGDHSNQTCRLSIKYYSKRGIKINIYEEGTKHYQDDDSSSNLYCPKTKKVIAKITDLLFYLPFWRLRNGDEMFEVERAPFCELPVHRRYSILDKYHLDIDLNVKIGKLNNNVLKEYILKDLPDEIENKKISLFLSEPIYADICGDEKIYLDIIKETAQNDLDTDLFLIKYHPREPQEVRTKIESIFKEVGKPYQVLTADVPLPIELYFEYLSPQKLILFMTSTYLYAPQIAPNTKVQMLIHEYAKRCRALGYDMSRLDKIMSNLGLNK